MNETHHVKHHFGYYNLTSRHHFWTSSDVFFETITPEGPLPRRFWIFLRPCHYSVNFKGLKTWSWQLISSIDEDWNMVKMRIFTQVQIQGTGVCNFTLLLQYISEGDILLFGQLQLSESFRNRLIYPWQDKQKLSLISWKMHRQKNW